MKYDNWQIKSKYPENIVDSIIKSRKITNKAEFLNPDYKNICPPQTLLNIKKAADRIREAADNNQIVGLFCDYDADGVSGGAIMYRVLKKLGIEVREYVPERKEGYGLNDQAVNYFIKSGVKLLITVDCGIKNSKQIALLKKSLIDSIVVDHHIIDEDVPEAIIVHPALTKNKKNLEFSGGGTAYMLAREVLREDGSEKWLIDLAAISSVADVVPLNCENRIIVKYGMIVLEKTKNNGLKELLDVSGLKGKKLSVYDLGFALAPRLNAAGRIAHPADSFNLLAKDDANCKQIATKLNQLNQRRQEMLSKAVDEALEKVINEKKSDQNIIIVKGDWDEGIVGLIASRICEKYYRPTIVLSEGAEILKGSARSIEKVNVTELISNAEKYLLSFGGHAQAAGLSLNPENYLSLEKILQKKALEFDKSLFGRSLKIDALVKFNQLNLKLADDLEQLSPFGQGNSRPTFAIKNVEINSYELIGKDQTHMKVYFDCENKKGCFLLFNFDAKGFKVDEGNLVDIAFTLSINEFRGARKLDLIVEDVKKSQ